MLDCYFDDSGTHPGADVLVWGGIMGTAEQISDLADSWRKLLRAPLPGKPPLKQFHLSHCASANGEFVNYTPGERDAVRYQFRKAISDSEMEAIAFAVSVRDWDELVRDEARDFFGSAEEVSMGGCINHGLQRSADRGENQVALTFDEGRRKKDLQGQLDRVKASYEGPADLVRIGFSPVGQLPALQAADTIATESYWYALDWLTNPHTPLKPHFRSLLEGLSITGQIMDRDETKRNLDHFNGNVSSGPASSAQRILLRMSNPR